MKKLAFITALVLSTASVSALASPQQGGFQGPSDQSNKAAMQNGGFVNKGQAVSQVIDIASMKDDQYVVLQGKIVQQVDNDEFLFRDASGEIVVEIERKAWRGQQITPNDEIKVYGEVDKSWNKTEVEAHNIEKLN
ncbi:YgiW/YdeI family stress tolerance OB fold protein [Glaesserella sp.]|uniref:YgiW/YdeI family stress tolerance OB fold protein n=1 Tax=Glaesserella sp. TaxID=2094731 RepID=UPI0035A06930